MKSRKKKWRNERKMGEEGGRGKGRAVHLQKWGIVEEEKGKKWREKDWRKNGQEKKKNKIKNKKWGKK